MKKDWLYLRQRIWSRIQEGKWRGAELERRGDTQYCQVSYNMEMQLQWSKGSKGRMWMGTRLQYAHVTHIWINGVMINRELASADHWQLSCAPGWTENDYKKQTWNNEKLCQRNLKIKKQKCISPNSVMKTKWTHFSKKWQK